MALSQTRNALITGLAVGLGAYAFAQALVPSDVPNSTEHDLALARRLGYVYAFAIAGWVAWLHRSWRVAWIGAVVAVATGAAYSWLCESGEFFSIMVAFPCLLGGLMAVMLPSTYSTGIGGVFGRFAKGLCAGLVLGFVYMFTLNMTGTLFAGPWISRDIVAYRVLMWKTGPVALGIASALFFPMFRWAIGLTRIVVEERDA